MRHPLTPDEQAALRRLEEQLRSDDPELADRLRWHGGMTMQRFSPRCWPSTVYLVIGLAFLACGALLDVGSAALAGVVALAVAGYRSPACRRLVLRTIAGLEPPRR